MAKSLKMDDSTGFKQGHFLLVFPLGASEHLGNIGYIDNWKPQLDKHVCCMRCSTDIEYVSMQPGYDLLTVC